MNDDTPDFSTWQRENLESFATEAYIKLREQHELLQYLRQLIASAPHDHETPTRKAD